MAQQMLSWVCMSIGASSRSEMIEPQRCGMLMKRSLITALAEFCVISSDELKTDGSDRSSAVPDTSMPAKTASVRDQSVERLVIESVKWCTGSEPVAETRMRLCKLSPRSRKALQRYVLNATERNAKTRARLRNLKRRTRRVLQRNLERAGQFGDGQASTETSPPTLDDLRATLVERPHQTRQHPVKWLGAVAVWAATRQDS
jgi:hypothetical protein